jgi:hypothetical protein
MNLINCTRYVRVEADTRATENMSIAMTGYYNETLTL